MTPEEKAELRALIAGMYGALQGGAQYDTLGSWDAELERMWELARKLE